MTTNTPPTAASVVNALQHARSSHSAHDEHVLHLYEDDNSLCRTVAEVVANGLAKNEHCLLVATHEHLAGITDELRVRGLSCEALESNRRLVKLDAQETLEKFARGPEIDRELCLKVLGNIISEVAGPGDSSVVVYGEMVDLLCKTGTPQAAIRLEQIWNELLKQHRIRLVCGYAAHVFGSENGALLDGVCSEHSVCLPSDNYLAADERTRLRQVLLLEQRARDLEAEVNRRRSLTDELTRFNRAAVGRELRILELKKEVNELSLRLGETARYASTQEPETSDREQPPRPNEPVVPAAPLESILRTEELERRPQRPPQYEMEHRALMSLIQALADSPRTILQVLADKILEVLNADSAGLSLLSETGDRFYWAAIAGMWKPHLGGGTPRGFGPCGDVLDCQKPLLFARWDLRYPYLREAMPLAEEGLLVPFFVRGRAVGTIWAIAHTNGRKFDGEDLRLLESLGQFASAAYEAVQTLGIFDQRQAALSLLEDSRRMQEKWKERERQLESITENMAAAVTRCSRDFKYLWVSKGYAAWMGKPSGEIVGRPIRDVVGDRAFDELRPYMERVLAGEKVEYTAPIHFLGPGKRWIRAVYVPTYTDETVDGWIAVITDLTEERRTVEMLRDQAQLLDLTQDAVLSLNWDGVIEFWNRGAEERYGWTTEEALGQVAHDLLGTEFPEPLSEIKQRLARDGYWQGELVHYKRDGTKIDVASRWALRRDLEERPCGFLEITTDITEHKHAEEQSRQSQRLESLGVLAGGIAHDFNNLLVGILGNASLALDVLGQQTPVSTMLEEVVGASERAAALTRQLLAYAGKEQLATRPIDLSILVRELGGLLRASIPKNVQLSLELTSGLPHIDGDPTQLQQVVMNLIINAAEAIPEGASGTVTVKTACRKPTVFEQAEAIVPLERADQPYLALTVADTGSGIAPAIRSRIFDPFYTTKFTGRGLGLSAVLGIIKAHRGSISFHSTVGSGTTFTVLLPSGAETVQPELANKSRSPVTVGTILVVDDEPTVRGVAGRILRRTGYEVLLAENGREAIEVLAIHPEIGAVVLDLAMPVMSGEQALLHLLQLRPALPIIISSGYSEAEARRRFTNAGVRAFIQKPYQAAALVDKVNVCLQEKYGDRSGVAQSGESDGADMAASDVARSIAVIREECDQDDYRDRHT